MRIHRFGARHVVGTLVLLLWLPIVAGGCATKMTVAARNEIATAEYAIHDAVEGGAEQYAGEQLATARRKLEEARSATPDVAVRLAGEAVVDARLAQAIARRDTALAQLAEE